MWQNLCPTQFLHLHTRWSFEPLPFMPRNSWANTFCQQAKGTLPVCFRGEIIEQNFEKMALKIKPEDLTTFRTMKDQGPLHWSGFFRWIYDVPQQMFILPALGKALPDFQFQNENCGGVKHIHNNCRIISNDITRITRLLMNVSCHLIVEIMLRSTGHG